MTPEVTPLTPEFTPGEVGALPVVGAAIHLHCCAAHRVAAHGGDGVPTSMRVYPPVFGQRGPARAPLLPHHGLVVVTEDGLVVVTEDGLRALSCGSRVQSIGSIIDDVLYNKSINLPAKRAKRREDSSIDPVGVRPLDRIRKPKSKAESNSGRCGEGERAAKMCDGQTRRALCFSSANVSFVLAVAAREINKYQQPRSLKERGGCIAGFQRSVTQASVT
eukprot:8714955-Pyramimonas_sp.AAC.2